MKSKRVVEKGGNPDNFASIENDEVTESVRGEKSVTVTIVSC